MPNSVISIALRVQHLPQSFLSYPALSPEIEGSEQDIKEIRA